MKQKDEEKRTERRETEWVLQVQDGALMIDGIQDALPQQEAAEVCVSIEVQMHQNSRFKDFYLS